MDRVTLARARAAAKFYPGLRLILLGPRPPWWRRLWNWTRRGFRKPPPPPTVTVVAIDYDAGIVEVR